jgi:hypothetical protein
MEVIVFWLGLCVCVCVVFFFLFFCAFVADLRYAVNVELNECHVQSTDLALPSFSSHD